MMDLIKENKLIVFGCIVAALFFFFLGKSYADSYHYSQPIMPANTEATVNNYSYQTKGIASAISAAQCHFDGGSRSLQLCSGVGFSGDSEAIAFGAGKTYKEFLINAIITIEDSQTRFGAGINWKIK